MDVHRRHERSLAVNQALFQFVTIVTLTYFGGEKAVPGYNGMEVCKAVLDSIVKYLAFDTGAPWNPGERGERRAGSNDLRRRRRR